MKRKNLTRNEVFEVWQALRTEEGAVSGLDIREKTRGGSLSTIYKYIREFEAAEKTELANQLGASSSETSAQPEISKNQLESGIQFLKSFWQLSVKEAEASFGEKEAQFTHTLSEQENRLSSKQEEIGRLLTELEEEEKTSNSLETELSQMKDSLIQAKSEAQILREQFSFREKELKAQADAHISEIEALRKESNHLREKIAVVGELQALKTQFEIREREYKERLSAQVQELTTLRQESNILRERAAISEGRLVAFKKNETP